MVHKNGYITHLYDFGIIPNQKNSNFYLKYGENIVFPQGR